MKLKGIYSAALAILLLAGCANDSNEKTSDESAAASRVDSILGNTSSNGAPSTATSSGNVKLNPPHGEPGHRCELAVGAPLNSAGDQPEINIVENPSPPMQQAATPQPTESAANMLAKGLNPPHGAPGHDCAISVGQPLKK